MKNIILIVIILFTISSTSQEQNLNLMPWPQEITKGEAQHRISSKFTIAVKQQSTKRIDIATTKFLRRLSGRTGVFIDQGFASANSNISNPSLEISFDRVGRLEINENESYQLNVSKNKITIQATTDIGVIYALETLLQTVSNNNDFFFFQEVTIKDSPRFTWRGLMIDAARHFQPIAVIKRNLNAMAAVKLNVFHWHLTDDQGFRVESKTYPKLHELGSDGQYYTQNQIKEIVSYASERGIRVVPEFDVPGHATAILTAYPEISSKNTSYSIERFAGIFDPTLDPTNKKTYTILNDLFGEMALLFPDKYFHIGGDENEGKHWDENEKIQQFKYEHQLKTNHDLQTYFNIRLEKILANYGKSLMGWEEIMTSNMPTTALIHSWKGVNEGLFAGQSLINATKNGYNTVLSNGFYIDLLQPASEHYTVNLLPKNNNLTALEKARILGGEATMWSELVTPLTIDSRLWPRTAAIAERFWSSENINDVSNMYNRLAKVSLTLEELGITHLKNRDVILRNIAKYNAIEALVKLTKVYEPLKIYSRNKGGTEYRSFSPFTLFADACTADASDARHFNDLVTRFISTNDTKSKNNIIQLLKSWIANDITFSKMKSNPILKTIEPLSKNLAAISKTMLLILETEKGTETTKKDFEKQFAISKKPISDVELIVLGSFKKLVSYLEKH